MYIEVVGKKVDDFCNKKVILFGAGSCGRRALEEFEKIGVQIVGFCDNNPKLIGSKIDKYPVLGPQELNTYQDANIIITSTYEEEIKKQLDDLKLDNVYIAKIGVLKKTIAKKEFHNLILDTKESNDMIAKGLRSNQPFFIGRLGSVELECISHYLYFLQRKDGKNNLYPDNVKYIMNINAGFFPTNELYLDKFSRCYLDNIKTMDLIWSMWFSEYEDRIYQEYAPKVPVIEYDSTCLPIQLSHSWVQALEGKKVLVIHPFQKSIEQNYLKRDLIYPNGFLPEFQLTTIKAVQSIAGNQTSYDDWFSALDSMQKQMDQVDFDIVLIGAGAYGLPLAAYAKKMGKKAVHVGGILQLFFGIKGKAWDYMNIYNEHWTNPEPEETPSNFKKVEAGRYW